MLSDLFIKTSSITEHMTNMSPGSGNRQTGTIPKTKVRNNCNVPQEAVTPTRRDIHLGNLVTTLLDLVPVPEYSVNSSQNRNHRTGIDDDSNHHDYGSNHHDYAESLVHEGGRFVPVRPQPRTPIPKAPVAHRECPVFSRYRDSMASSEQMEDSFGSPNPYFVGQNQRQNNAAAVMIVNPTTANSGNQQIQPNAENYQNANSIVVRNNSIGRTNFTSNRTSSQPRAQATKTLPNHNTVMIGPSVSSAPKASNIIHNGFNPASGQPNNASADHQDQRLSEPEPHSVEFELGQIRGYIRATSNLVHDLRAVENEDEDQERLLQGLLNKLNKMKDNEKQLEVMLLQSTIPIESAVDGHTEGIENQSHHRSGTSTMLPDPVECEIVEVTSPTLEQNDVLYENGTEPIAFKTPVFYETVDQPSITELEDESLLITESNYWNVPNTSNNLHENNVDNQASNTKERQYNDCSTSEEKTIINKSDKGSSTILRDISPEEAARPASAQSNCSSYSENELFQVELRVKLEKSQQKIQALQEQQKQLLMCQQAAKFKLAKMNAALANRPSHENEQPCQLNCMAAANGMLNDAGTNTQNYQQIQTINRDLQQHDLGFTSTPPQFPDFNNHHLRDFNQQVNAMQTERFIRNPAQVSQGTSHQENYTEGCESFRLERLSNNMTVIEEIINTQGSDSEGEEDSRRIQHSVELQQKLMELQAKTAHIENMFTNFKKDQGASGSTEPSISNDTLRKSRRSNSSSLSPITVTRDAPHNYTYSQDNTLQSHSSDEDNRRHNNGATIENDLMSNQAAQINVMEMKLEKLKGMMQTVASIENRLATSALDEPSHAPNVQQLNNLDNMYARSAVGEPANPMAVEASNECNSRNRYEDISQSKHQNYSANLSSRRFNDTSAANKCRNIEEQNASAHEKIATSMTAMNELTEQLKREVRDIADQRQKLRCAAARSSQYTEAHAGEPASPDRKRTREAQFDDRKRRLHSLINRGFDSTEDSPESPRGRQSEVQSQQSQQSQRSQRSSVSVTSMSSHQAERTPNAHSCVCQPHQGFCSEQDGVEASTVSLVHRKNTKNTSSSTSFARGGQQDRSVRCTHSPISTPDQYKEESTYCDSVHSLDILAVIPNVSSSSNHTAHKVTRPQSKQRQQCHSCSSRIERESGAASDESAGSIPGAPPPPMSPTLQHTHRHRWPNAYFLHANANAPPAKESSCSGGETSTSMGPNISDTQRSWWQQKAEQLQQQLEQTRNLCQTLLQDRRFSQHRHDEHSQTLEPAPAGVSCPVPPAFPGTFMLPYGVMVPMPSDISGMMGSMGGAVGGGAVGGAAGGAWWALTGCYNQLNSQQWEISTLRNSLMMLEEKYSSLVNAVNHRAHSTPPHIPTQDECHQQHTIRTRSALSSHHPQNWQQHHQTAGNPQHRYHPSSNPVDTDHPVVHQRNVTQDHVNYHSAANAHLWTSHEGRALPHDPPNRTTPVKITTQQQYVMENTHAEFQPSNTSYDNPNTNLFNNYTPPAMPNLNILNSIEPQLIQNNTNPNCLLSLTPAQQNPINHSVTSSPAGPSAPVAESSQNMALNNQVPPGNRANNYWDNFRSYSRQNLLSGSSKTNADSSMAAFTLHNPQPLAERSHNTLHSSSTNTNVTHNTPTNTPKRNVNSATANTSNLPQTNNSSSQVPIEVAIRSRGRRNITQDSSIFAAPPDVLNVNQNSESVTETELNSGMLNEDSASRFNASVNFNVNREYDSLQDRKINVVNPIPEILVSHTNNFLNMGGNKRKSSSKLPAKNTSTNYSLEHIHNRNIDLTNSAEVPNLNLASASTSRSQDKSTAKLFDLLRENVYSEVTALISANESHPHFLIQLFRDLQQIRSDPLRQRMLASIQEVSHDGIIVEEHSQNMPGCSRSTLPSADQDVTSSTECKFSTVNTNVPTSNISSQIITFISNHTGPCSNEFLISLSNLIKSLRPAESSPPDFVDRINVCLSKYENANVPDVSESILADIRSLIDGEINNGTDKEGLRDESDMQDVAGSLERTFIINSNADLDNNRQTSDYGEGDACLPPVVSLQSCSYQPDQDGLRNGSGEGDINARSSEPKIDLIESAEVCNGDLAEADQSRHDESISDHSVGVGGDVILANSDALPDVVDTEEQTPTEAEAEWLGLDRVPTRLHPEDGPENQTESGHG